MSKKASREEHRKRIHKRIRRRVFGTAERPRVCVYKSLKNIYVTAIDDSNGSTLASSSTLSKELRGKLKYGSNIEAAKAAGELMAQRLGEKGIKNVVFDRSGYLYHGRVKAVAEAIREKGFIK